MIVYHSIVVIRFIIKKKKVLQIGPMQETNKAPTFLITSYIIMNKYVNKQ